MTAIFDSAARQTFAANYPETPHKLAHHLESHALLTIEALASLGETLPATSVEYNKGDLPVHVLFSNATIVLLLQSQSSKAQPMQ